MVDMKNGGKMNKLIKHIILEGTIAEKLELYGFDEGKNRRTIAKKFKYFARANFPQFFKKKSPEFHDDYIMAMIRSYYGENELIGGFRGCAKTSLSKLFVTFVLLNDRSHYRRYIKILSKAIQNSKQFTVDVYNMMVSLRWLYGNPFEKEGDIKMEEQMGQFTMKGDAKGRIKVLAGTVGQTQRGHVQMESRPDWIIFDDVEDKDTIESLTITQSIINKCGEAIDGLSTDGSFLTLCNYISDQGTVQWFMNKSSVSIILTTLLKDPEGKDFTTTVWPEAFPPEKCEQLKSDSDDFFGEYMCDPQRSQNKFFDLDKINRDLKECKEPKRVSAGVRYWIDYNPSHRFGQGSDHSDGVGLDSNTLAGFDFTTGELAYTYANNKIAPDLSAYEFARVGSEYGNCIWAPEINNNCGGTVITTAKSIPYPNLYRYIPIGKTKEKKSDKLGWETNKKTKYNAYSEFRKDYNDGNIKIYDKDVLNEMKAYTNNDLNETNTGLITRHFDLLTAVIIAWQMHKYAVQEESNWKESYQKYLDRLK